jgi:hypothetical protein
MTCELSPETTFERTSKSGEGRPEKARRAWMEKDIWATMSFTVVSHRISRINGGRSFIDSIQSFLVKINTFLMSSAV